MKPMSKHEAEIAWQKWQPQHFNDAKHEVVAVPADPLPINETEPVPVRDHQQELEAFRASIREQAWQEGYSAGKAQGEHEGYQAGLLQAEQAASLTQKERLAPLENLVQQLALSFDLLEETVSQRLIQLALEIAHQLIGDEVNHDSRVVLTQVKQLLAQEALLTGKLTLTLNPQDLSSLEEYLSTLDDHPRWEVVADNCLPRGDCRLVSEEGELESALSTRWQALCERAQQGAF